MTKDFWVRGRLVWDKFKTEYLIDGASILINGASVLINRSSVKEGLHSRFEAEFSSMRRSTSTCTTASLEDALASFCRSQVARVWRRQLHARHAQR